MIKEAEENAIFDKSKKALVNLTYEFDNLFLKGETFIENYLENSSDKNSYFIELLKEIKDLYSSNKLDKVNVELLDNLNYVYNLINF
jgi:hypothetical protein